MLNGPPAGFAAIVGGTRVITWGMRTSSGEDHTTACARHTFPVRFGGHRPCFRAARVLIRPVQALYMTLLCGNPVNDFVSKSKDQDGKLSRGSTGSRTVQGDLPSPSCFCLQHRHFLPTLSYPEHRVCHFPLSMHHFRRLTRGQPHLSAHTSIVYPYAYPCFSSITFLFVFTHRFFS